MSDIKIKECPHCGGAADLITRYSEKNKAYFVFVKCRICGAQGKICSSPHNPYYEGSAHELAIKAWNLRTGKIDSEDPEDLLDEIGL